MKNDEILGIVERHQEDQGSLIAILQDIQARYNYLPAEALRIVADQTGRSLVDIYGLATFYRAFSLEPRGKHLVSVCLGTACHVRGAPRVADEVGRQLGIKSGQTTADKMFTLETVNCLGACALGPVVVVDGQYFSGVNASKVRGILEKVREGMDKIEIRADRRIFPVEVSCSHCNHGLMDADHPIDGYPSIRITQSFGQQHGWLRLSSLYGSYNIESEY
ncbi:MAG: NAD(P)H-dependent oxidoreductase subunit E, partial [Deltaproteobacteria bacterium]|nr:NAD(P)H-dependent oxidoreductase subunit E [Deltaproteobacteria bacterium]